MKKDRFLKEANTDNLATNGKVVLKRYKIDAESEDVNTATPDANIELDLSPLKKEPTWYDETDQ